jgi:hypothetical protein
LLDTVVKGHSDYGFLRVGPLVEVESFSSTLTPQPGNREGGESRLWAVQSPPSPPFRATLAAMSKSSRTATVARGKPGDARLASYCWCKTKIMKVLVADVQAGKTLSCGKLACRPDHPSALHVPGRKW